MLLLGGLLASRLPIDLLPNTAPVQATIQTEAPGLVAEQVEENVTQPVENVLLGTPGVALVQSRSLQGLSVVTVEYASGADPARVRQLLTDDLSRVGALPPGSSAPRLSPPIAPGPDLLVVGLTASAGTPMDLRDVAQWTVRPRLLSTPGVGSVAIYGGQVRRIEVQARPGDLADSDLGFLDIVRATERATSVAGAGFIDTPNQRVLIEPRGQADTLDKVKEGQIQTPGADPVRIDDVADVSEVAAPAFGDALIMGKPGLLLVVDRTLGANTVETTRAAEATLAELRPALAAQGITVRTDLDRPADFISSTTSGLTRDLAVGYLLMALALAIGMRDLRMVLVTLAAAPLTLSVSLAAVSAFGWSLNAMTLGGLAVALALVVDDAVIDVESIVERLRDAERLGRSRQNAIIAASLEVRAPVLYATLAFALSLAPLLALPGGQGALLAPLAATVIVAAMASLIVSIVVTPALALQFLAHVRSSEPPALLGALRSVQARWLQRAAKWPSAVLVAGCAIALLAVFALALFHAELLPSLRDDHLVIETEAPAATSLDAARAAGAATGQSLAALHGVKAVSQRIGRDPSDNLGAGIEHSVYDLELAPGLDDAAQAAVMRQARAVLSGYPGPPALVRTRFDAGQSQGREATGLQIDVFGQDLDAADRVASQIRGVLAGLPDRPSIAAPTDTIGPVMRVDPDFNRLALDGLSVADVLDTVRAAFQGETVARIYDGPRVVDLAVGAQAGLRRDPEAIGALLLRSSSGFAVPLKSIANVYLSDGRTVILHEGGLRRTMVEAAPRDGDVDRLAKSARAAIASKVALPPGMFLGYRVINSAAAAIRDLLGAYALGLFAVVALLTVAFDGRAALLVVGSAAFGLVGGVAAIAALGGVASIGAMAGLVALVGLSIRSAIILVSRAEERVAQGAAWGPDTVIDASGERLAPLAASAVIVTLALLPLALDAGAPGREIVGPMACVVIAGVFTGTLGNLLVTPLLLLRFWRPRRA
jgi:Cu/Ag efflux pump CusA